MVVYPDEAYKDEEVLRELYLEKDNNLEEVANMLGVSYGKVYHYYDKYGLEKDAEYRFKRKFERDDDSGCWIWTAATDKDGYGVHSDDNDDYVRAHRFSYQIHKGEIPKGAYVLHNCHNPACVNPDHLRVGTNSDNMIDAFEEGDITTEMQREKVRELNREQVIEIRNRYQEEDISQVDLAAEYGVSGPTVNELLNGVTWSDVGGKILD
jgi:plasmid maintenance system antidote protein VapI